MSRLRTLARIELPLAWPVTAVDPGPDTTTGPKTNLADAKAAAASLAEGRRSRPGWGLMIGQPLFVGLVVAGWAIWRNTAELDSIEQRQLQWAEIGRLTVQHLWLTLVATVIVLAVSVPLRIALTRKGLRRAGCTSDE